MRLCYNKKTGVVYVWNECLANNPDIELLPEEVQDGSAGASEEHKEEVIEGQVSEVEATEVESGKKAEEVIRKLSRKKKG